MVDIDGVISLFASSPAGGRPAAVGWPAGAATVLAGGAPGPTIAGALHSIDGIPHFLSETAARHLLELAQLFELVWASGWEEKANEHLPHLLGLPRGLPFLRFARSPGTTAHWKLESIDAYAGERALAWVDDALTADCAEWAAARRAPTLLVRTAPERGLTAREAGRLARWARALL